MSADTIMNLGKTSWDIIKDGVATPDGDLTANAVPQVDDWHSLSGVLGPNVHRLHYFVRKASPFEDRFQVEFDIEIKWQFGARYKGGGAYIPNLWVEVPACSVAWLWHVDIRMSVHPPVNSAGEGKPPNACIPFTIKGEVGSPVVSRHVEWGFEVYGNGEINGPW
jgi:hypothetical protein